MKERPTLSMNDIGIKGLILDGDTRIDYGEVNMPSLFNYMLAKNECWEYEKEWRIIDMGKAGIRAFLICLSAHQRVHAVNI